LAYQRLLKLVEKDFIKLSTQWGKPDLIHAHVVLPGGWITVQLGRRHGIPVVLTEHSGPFSMQLQTASQRRWVSETLTQADGLIAVSPALAQQIRAFRDDVAIHVIGNLIKTDFFTPAQKFEAKSPGTTTRFLSVGLLTWQKGISYLLQAAQQLLQRQITSFEIIIGGNGPERRRLESLAQNLGLNDRCWFLGLLSPAEVKHWMQQCDVFIMSSLHETFCIVLGEAMACGKPVIATRSGGPEFVVTRETGVLVEPANPTALADAMQDFMASKLKFDSQRLRQRVIERFGEEIFLRQISAVYEQIWSKKR
jgi:glycosyltransferase involved in cell wall biosynthesis